jgi:hypothetical protein
MTQAAVGFRVHSGWAAAVIVAGSKSSPLVVDRRRIELTDGLKQPYHAAKQLPLTAAESLIERCRESARLWARRGLDEIMRAHPIGACGILLAAGRPLPELAAILASHALLHTAEGEFFRQAIIEVSRELGLAVRAVKERELLDVCAAELKLSPDKLRERLAEWGRALGPPWRHDEKYAALAAWLSLERVKPSMRE